MVEGQEYEQGHYEEQYDEGQQAEYQEYQVKAILASVNSTFLQEEQMPLEHHQERHSPHGHRQQHQVQKNHYQQSYQQVSKEPSDLL